jgi:hypothetical protein
LVVGERLGLLVQSGGEGSRGQPQGSSEGNLFHGVEVDIETGAVVAKGTTGNNFAPSGSEFADLLQHFRGQRAL